MKWAQGDHVIVAAPTNAGKTTLMAQLVKKRGHVVVFVSKTKDETFKTEFGGFERIREWPPPQWAKKVLLWPKSGETLLETLAIQKDVYLDAFNHIGRQGGWCCVIDETHWMTDPGFCGLGKQVAILHHQGRSSGVSMVNLTQRPSWIPKIIYSSVSHAYIARTADPEDLKRLADLGGIDAKAVKDTLIQLPDKRDYLYVSPQTDAVPAVVNTRK